MQRQEQIYDNSSRAYGYVNGRQWCSRCATFRHSWNKKKGWCEDCHCKMRKHAYTKQAKKRRELTLIRY